MLTRTMTNAAAFALLLLAASGCVDALPPGTTPASTPVSAAPGEALVTFVRPESSCDTGEYAVVVDDQGQFVGNVAAGTQIAYSAKAGTHAFFAWSNTDLHVDKEPAFNHVSAIRTQLRAGEGAVVALEVASPCAVRATFEMNAMTAEAAQSGDVAKWLQQARAVTVDRAAGQLALESHPVHLRTGLEFGAAKLRRLDDAEVRRVLHDAIQKEDSVD